MGARRPVSDEHLAAIDRIGVASELTDHFHLIHIGITIFGNKYSIESVPDWKIDEHAEAVLSMELSKSDRFSVGTVSGSFLRNVDKYDIDYAALFSAAADQGFDTIVVARPAIYDNQPFIKGGYGFYERSTVRGKTRCAYSLFVLEVMDVASQKELAWEWGFPCTEGDEDIEWKESFGGFSNAERKDLERRVKRGVADSIETAVVKLRLLDAK